MLKNDIAIFPILKTYIFVNTSDGSGEKIEKQFREMNLINGKYLKHDIWAFGGRGDWLVVYDGKYNYMLFNCVPNAVLTRYKQKRMPCNGAGSSKHVEYYSTFENALGNLCRVIVNDGFKPTFLRDVFERSIKHKEIKKQNLFECEKDHFYVTVNQSVATF